MLFFVVETFRGGDPRPVHRRFAERGRLLPEGVLYRGSWIDAANARCFQIVEAPEREALQQWLDRWSDLIDFDVIPVVEPAAYWARYTDADAPA